MSHCHLLCTSKAQLAPRTDIGDSYLISDTCLKRSPHFVGPVSEILVASPPETATVFRTHLPTIGDADVLAERLIGPQFRAGDQEGYR